MYVSISGSTVLDGTGFASCNGSAPGVGVVKILQAFLGITVQGEESVAKTPHGKIEAILSIIPEEYQQFLLNFSVKHAIILLL